MCTVTIRLKVRPRDPDAIGTSQRRVSVKNPAVVPIARSVKAKETPRLIKVPSSLHDEHHQTAKKATREHLPCARVPTIAKNNAIATATKAKLFIPPTPSTKSTASKSPITKHVRFMMPPISSSTNSSTTDNSCIDPQRPVSVPRLRHSFVRVAQSRKPQVLEQPFEELGDDWASESDTSSAVDTGTGPASSRYRQSERFTPSGRLAVGVEGCFSNHSGLWSAINLGRPLALAFIALEEILLWRQEYLVENLTTLKDPSLTAGLKTGR